MSDQRLEALMGGYSIITALSQRSINEAMKKLIETHQDLTQVDVHNRSGHKLTATIGLPLVSLKVKGASRADLEYTCRLASGNLHFSYFDDDGNLAPVDYDVKDWTVAFNVKIGAKVLEPQDEGYDTAREAIQQPGDYSIEHLFIEFNEGEITKPDPDRCDFNGTKLDQFELLDFCSLLALWYIVEGPTGDKPDSDKKKVHLTVGYGLQSRDPPTVIPPAPELVPTSLRFQTYEYKAPGQDDADEGILDGDNNALLYLQMTKDKPFPEPEILPYTGNFTGSGIPGTMCICRDLFFEDYLLRVESPLLQMLNQTTYIWVKSHSVPNMHIPKYDIGVGDEGHGSDQTFFQYKADLNNLLMWRFSPDAPTEQHIYDEMPGSGNAYNRLTIDCDTNNIVSAKPGTNTIDVAGKSNVTIKVDVGSSGWGGWYKIRATLTWESQVTITAGDKGLVLSLNVHDDTFKVISPDPDWDISGAGGITSDTIFEERDKVQQRIKDALRSNKLQDTEKKLQNELATVARLVVPGQGTFSYRSPVFNNNGDLMIEIAYQD